VKQSVRDVVTGDLSLEYFARRFREGWRVASIEWVRESAEVGTPADSQSLLNEQTALPYGFRIAEDGFVQENPLEAAALLLILDQIVREKRIQEIARELNQQGYFTREGTQWTATDVFNLMPRLIEAGPSLLKSTAWQQRRPAIQRTAERAN
jgi:Recombinase